MTSPIDGVLDAVLPAALLAGPSRSTSCLKSL